MKTINKIKAKFKANNRIAKFSELKMWQRKHLLFGFLLVFLIGTVYLSVTAHSLYKDRRGEHTYWDSYLDMDVKTKKLIQEKSENATIVTTGTYLENLKEISLKNNYFRAEYLIWFRWDNNSEIDMIEHFRIYKGSINKMEIVKDYHENGQNYQLIRADISVTKQYWTPRFPLESHQLRMYIESEYPIEDVILKDDSKNSGYNRNLNISGYKLRQFATSTTAIKYENSHSDPELEDTITTSEHITAIEINRNGPGLYFKCFIALFGTTLWVLITLFLCTYHKVDPLGMIPAALFGTVSNIMVGANLLPDALELGLLEFINIWGILTILAVTFAIININRIRNHYEEKEYARLYGIVMFYTITFIAIIGHIILPLMAYMF